MNSLVSIVIPTYQHANTISYCLESVFAQTHKNVQVIVVNDGSTDQTEELLEPYRDRILYIRQENTGSNPARNQGFKHAAGRFILFCDADVRMKPEMIETLLSALGTHSDVSFAYSSFKFGWKIFNGTPYDENRLKKRNFIHTSALIRTKDFPGFDNAIKRLQDWDVWLTMSEQGKKGVLVPEVLFEVSIDGDSRVGSSWMPSFVYQIPWKLIGWAPKQIKKYNAARSIIAQKHNLPYED